jgi:hypothetical protein
MDKTLMSAKEPGTWPEVLYAHPAGLKASYVEGSLFRQWCKKYEGRLLFCDRMLTSGQIPHSGPIRGPMFFHELFLGTQYLDAGYGAVFFYRQVEDMACYQKACELLGGSAAAQFITPNWEKGGRAPDLLVFDPPTGRFRFVECKGRNERFTPKQVQRFREIEDYLNQTSKAHAEPLTDDRDQRLFPALASGQWIHIARLFPSTVEGVVT